MLKKGLIGLAVAGLLGTFVFGREAISYVRTGFSNIRNAVKAEVPIKFEIERAQTLINQLVPDTRSCMHAVAEQQVDIEARRMSLERKEAEIAKQRDVVISLRKNLGSGKGTFVFASHSYSANDVKRDLASRFERFKTAEDSLAADRQILAAREQMLAANHEKLERLLNAKKELEVQVEQLQARATTMEAAATVSRLSIDDSNLSQARKLISDLGKQLDIKQKMLDTETAFVGLIPAEHVKGTADVAIEQQIDAYFNAAEVNASQSLVLSDVRTSNE